MFGLFLSLGINYGVSSCGVSIVKRTLRDCYCHYSSSQAILKFSQCVKGHFVMLKKIGKHIITCNPGPSCSKPN